MTDKYSTKNPRLQIASAGISGLNTIVVATQPTIDLKLSTGQLNPVSLHALVITSAGERKTMSDSIFCKYFPRARKGRKG